MTNLLLILAVVGMVVGVYAVAMPTLTRRGWRLPFASFFSDADEEDEPGQSHDPKRTQTHRTTLRVTK